MVLKAAVWEQIPANAVKIACSTAAPIPIPAHFKIV
jgi:hypothetical protein